MRRRRTVTAAALAVGLLASHLPQAAAAWSTAGSGAGGGVAATMPAGATPSARASADTVTVAWASVTVGNRTAVAGYVIHRYSAVNGSPATVGGSCAGVVATTTCSETVPAGTWTYTDTPVQLSWTGSESSAGNSVTAP